MYNNHILSIQEESIILDRDVFKFFYPEFS